MSLVSMISSLYSESQYCGLCGHDHGTFAIYKYNPHMPPPRPAQTPTTPQDPHYRRVGLGVPARPPGGSTHFGIRLYMRYGGGVIPSLSLVSALAIEIRSDHIRATPRDIYTD